MQYVTQAYEVRKAPLLNHWSPLPGWNPPCPAVLRDQAVIHYFRLLPSAADSRKYGQPISELTPFVGTNQMKKLEVAAESE